MATNKSLETEIAVIQTDIGQIGSLFQKLEITLDKLTDVNNNLSQIIAVHEQRLNEGAKEFTSLKTDMDTAENRFDDEVKDMHSRLTSNTRDLENKMTHEIDKVLEAIKDLKTHLNIRHDKLEDRVAMLEKWRWIIVGIFVATSLFLPEIKTYLAF
jgi:peptidoglycan hydrolase CwlO-like protein